jgi:hypothetical protein
MPLYPLGEDYVFRRPALDEPKARQLEIKCGEFFAP